MKLTFLYDEVLKRIVEIYKTLDCSELEEEYNKLFPDQPITYECDGYFAKYMDAETDNIKCRRCGELTDSEYYGYCK